MSKLQAFWYRDFQTFLILNGRLDVTNNHKYMKFPTMITKHLRNVMLKACIWEKNPITFEQECKMYFLTAGSLFKSYINRN